MIRLALKGKGNEFPDRVIFKRVKEMPLITWVITFYPFIYSLRKIDVQQGTS